VTYLVKNASKFKNFIVDVICMFKPSKVIINYFTQVFATNWSGEKYS